MMLQAAANSSLTVIVLAAIAAMTTIVTAIITFYSNRNIAATKVIAQTAEKNSNSRLTELFAKVEGLSISLERSKGETAAANQRTVAAVAATAVAAAIQPKDPTLPTPPPGEIP